MPLPAPRRRPTIEMFNPYLYYGNKTTQQTPSLGQTLSDKFRETFMDAASPEEMYRAESAPLETAFEEAGEKMRDRLAASGGAGNVRAIIEGEKGLARTKGETLRKLKSEVTDRALSRQLLGAQLLEILQSLGGAASTPSGSAVFGR